MIDKEYLAAGLGLCALDYISIVDTYPSSGKKIDAVEFSLQGGGPVPTAMATLSRLGGRCAFIGRCGKDSDSAYIKNELEEFGIDTSGLILDPNSRTPRAFIWVDSKTGERTVVLDRTVMTDLRPEEIDKSILENCRFFHMDGRETEACLFAAKYARKHGAKIVLDAGSPRNEIEKLLEFTDYLVVSQNFAESYTGRTDPEKAIRHLIKPAFEAVVITLGDQGAIGASDDQVFHQPAFEIDPVDTTGAGDVFHGAFIYGLGQGWSIGQTVRFASAAAAIKCTRIGGRQGSPTLEEVERLLNSNLTK